MARVAPLPLKLHRATVRTAAVAFWGLGAVVLVSDYIGPGQHVDYPIAWAITLAGWAMGAVCWFFPWDRLRLEWFLAMIGGGLAMLAASVMVTGGLHSHLLILYLVVVVFTASLMDLAIAAAVAVIAGLAALIPLVVAGWDGFYARSLLVLAAAMVICAYLPARVRRALREEGQLAESRRRELEDSYLATIGALAAALDAKDRHTEAHSRETAALARAVGRRLGLADDALRFLEYGALLHDIGKIGIPGYVLNKPGPLDSDEMALMREHPVIGERILASVPFLAPVRKIVRAEHERWDGTGYPDGLRGEDIPIEARIIHACDAFQAMSTNRPYRRALPRERALGELRSQAGRQFDPSVVKLLLEVIEAGEVTVSGDTGGPVTADRPVADSHSWTRHLEAIEALGARLLSTIEVQEVCRLIGETIVTLLPYDQCRVYLLSNDGKILRAAYFSDSKRIEYTGVTADGLQVQIGEGITGWVAETKRGVVIGDTANHPKALQIPGTTENDESMLAVPVVFEEKLVGVIVTVKLGLHQYGTDQLRLLTILANQAGVSIANARLIEQLATSAITDPLTGLPNRRAFEERLRARLDAVEPKAFTVLMLDVDGLKRVNDLRGHTAGDAALRRVADVLRANLRDEDLVTRWGGDEFLLLLNGMDRVGAVSLARRISGTLLTVNDSQEPISVSVGTASFPSEGTTAEELLAAADRSMYAEKRNRERVA